MKFRTVVMLACSCSLSGYAQVVGAQPEPAADAQTEPQQETSTESPGGFGAFLNRDAVRGALMVIRDIAGQVAFVWGTTQNPHYGLFLDDDWQQHGADRPLAVIVHGYGSGAEAFGALRERLRDAGLASAVFSYPNDAAVALSGRELARALQEFERRYPDRRLALVAHSMGGLLSRVAIEDPDTAVVGNVDRLIMVATPNQGSNLARVPVSLDFWQNWVDGEPDTIRSVLLESLLDGLNEARIDLQPESEFLARLNGLSRNPDVRYSLILGNKGPATREQLDELRRVIIDSQNANVALRALGPRLDALLEDLDELVDGLGDGAVALERGRLQGVDDTIVLEFHHGLITSELTDAGGNRLVDEILTRLEQR